jgi:hypothetical protein
MPNWSLSQPPNTIPVNSVNDILIADSILRGINRLNFMKLSLPQQNPNKLRKIFLKGLIEPI